MRRRYPVAIKYMSSKLFKIHNLKFELLSDLALKFQIDCLQYLFTAMNLDKVLNISISNIKIKDRFDFLRLNRLFDPIRYFHFFVYNNYYVKSRNNFSSKVVFSANRLVFSKIYDFLIFLLATLSSKSRTMMRSFVLKSMMQINCYNYLTIGFLDSKLDYYGWKEPLVLRFKLNQMGLKKVATLERLFSTLGNYFLFYLLKLKVRDIKVK